MVVVGPRDRVLLCRLTCFFVCVFFLLQFDRLHSVEAGRLEDSQKRAIEELVKIQAKVSVKFVPHRGIERKKKALS